MPRRLPSHAEILARVARYRDDRRGARPAVIETPGPGRESVWDFPRPPALRQVGELVRVNFAGAPLISTSKALEIIETASAPVIYAPPEDVDLDRLAQGDLVTICEWKGAAVHYDIVGANGRRSPRGAFAYPDPLTDLGMGYERIAGWIAVYPDRVDECWRGDERARAQDGGFYAGWVTSRLAGPIKGALGTEGW